MKSSRLALLAVTCAAFTGACHRSDNTPPPIAAEAPAPAPAPAPPPEPKLSDSDRSFFTQAAQADTLEVEASKLAAAQGSNATIKSFAATMVTDHTAAADELKALAAQKKVTLPDDAGPHNADLDSLKKLKGGAFDKAYAQKIGVAAHNEAVALFDTTSKDASDPDVKSFAAKTLPTLQHHLEMAKALPHAK